MMILKITVLVVAYMTRLLLILLLLFIGCDSTEPINTDMSGCPIEESCNFNPYANNEENCWYPNQNCSCEDGENAISDNCGICDLDETNDCIQDECGVWGGDGVDEDEDGICDDIDNCIDLYLNENCEEEAEEECVGCVNLTIINSSDIEATCVSNDGNELKNIFLLN